MCARRTASPVAVLSARSPLFRGPFLGVLAWLVGFVATLAVTYARFSSYRRYASPEFSRLDTVFFTLEHYPDYHLVDALGSPVDASVAVVVVLVALPAVAMVIGGALSAARDPRDRRLAGATVAVGYFAVHLAVVFVLATGGNGPLGTVTPASVATVASNGLAQPAVLGAVGGLAVR
jgi:purine-cytosine permease-like protein